MKRIKLVVAYDGTNYCGWQLQKNGVTIEEVLNRELTALLKEPIAVTGASRTDAGVHALGNVAVFDTENRMAADKVCLAVNQSLPEDIRVQSSQEVPLTWHPRKANCVKTYEYRVENRRIGLPTKRLYSYFCYYPLDVEKMRRAAGFLLGEHDFKSFCTAKSKVEDTVRTIYRLDIEKDGDSIVFRVSGSGFLYNMVRIIVGTLLQVGTGALPPGEVASVLAARDRKKAGPTAPARGLTLAGMEYEEELPRWQHSKNGEWEYRILQSHIREAKAAYFRIERCLDEEWEGLLRRNVHHAFRNGARYVLVADLEKNRLQAGQHCGHYRIERCGGEMLRKAFRILEEEEKRAICHNAEDSMVWFCAVDEQEEEGFSDTFAGGTP
ncbi:tRNA pseudouridine(38-40) synthase TruA [Clostridiaceae bacterium]|nr:tRNA pseudouridine(38-40) synthase TruA [Clostridiaceae bacterium]RKI10936.1 tRNA pseudouridine(38-40) synthase TruA [bacterium 1XD21-70]